MDHLPPRPALRIPFLCCESAEYDRRGFLDYPKRSGWESFDGSQKWYHCVTEEAARRAQLWLYFGLLSEFLGKHVDKTLLYRSVKTGQGTVELVIDSTTLPKLIQKWSWDSPRTLAPNELLGAAEKQCNLLNREQEPARSVAFSINVLINSIRTHLRNYWEGQKHTNHKKQDELECIICCCRDIESCPGENDDLLRDLMLRKAWCPSQIPAILNNYSYAASYYLACLPRRGHTMNHSNCLTERCLAANVIEGEYQTPHTCRYDEESLRRLRSDGVPYLPFLNYDRWHYETAEDPCILCRFVEVDVNKVVEIIASGGIPLIQINYAADHAVELEVVRATPDTVFVAISHVWSGGLGNYSNKNGLQSCVLTLLKRMFTLGYFDEDKDPIPEFFKRRRGDDIPNYRRDGLLIWMDTLCIPVENCLKHFRRLAIDKMAQVYATATSIVIIDAELRIIRKELRTNQLLFAHIFASSWMTRSWTFQEATFAQQWYVLFADGLYEPFKRISDIDQMIDQHINKGTLDDDAQVTRELSSWFRKMPSYTLDRADPRTHFNDYNKTSHEFFALVWNNLRGRSTTKLVDVYRIFAIMLGLRPSEIVSLRGKRIDGESSESHEFLANERMMKAILISQPTLPLSLLFNDGPRARDRSGRVHWVPVEIGGAVSMSPSPAMFQFKDEDGDISICFDSSDVSIYLIAKNYPLSTTCMLIIDDEGPETIWVELRLDGCTANIDHNSDLCVVMNTISASQNTLQTLAPFHPGAFFATRGSKEQIGSIEDAKPSAYTMQHLTYICPVRGYNFKPRAWSRQDIASIRASKWPHARRSKELFCVESDTSSWHKPQTRRARFTFMDGYNFKLLLLVQSVYTAYWIIGIKIALNYMEPSRAGNFILSLAFAIRYMLLIKEAIRAESIPPQRLYTGWVQSLSDNNNNSTAQAIASDDKTTQHPLNPDLVVIGILAIIYTCILLILEAIGYEITTHTGETIACSILSIPVRSSIWIWGDTPAAAYRRNPKFSIHNGATATWLILGTCCAVVIFVMMVVPPLKPLALLSAVIACELLFRWGLELVAAVVPFRLLPLRLLGLEDFFLRNKWFLVQYFSESWLTRCLKRAVIWPFGVFVRRLEKHGVGETSPLLYDRQSRSVADRV